MALHYLAGKCNVLQCNNTVLDCTALYFTTLHCRSFHCNVFISYNIGLYQIVKHCSCDTSLGNIAAIFSSEQLVGDAVADLYYTALCLLTMQYIKV